jgi:hypothetical protein
MAEGGFHANGQPPRDTMGFAFVELQGGLEELTEGKTHTAKSIVKLKTEKEVDLASKAFLRTPSFSVIIK